MGRRPQYRMLDVRLNGRLAGHYRMEADGGTSFRYAQDWLDWDHSFALSRQLPLIATVQRGPAVLAVFDNLLPDGDHLRRLIAERSGARSDRPFDLLAAIGHDCVGAMQFVPAGSAGGDPFALNGTPQSEAEIAQTLRNLAVQPLGIREDEPFRISLAGAQEKTAYLQQDGRWLRPEGLTATTHIFKRPMGLVNAQLDMTSSVENEFLCLHLAARLGLEVNAAQIAQFEDQKVLIVTRFDRAPRPKGGILRLPQEDFLQSLGRMSAQKYQQHGGPGLAECLDLLMGSARRQRDLVQFLKAQVIFWMLGAIDGHAKNYSSFLGPGGQWMTPFYDIMSGVPALRQNSFRQREFQLAMSAGQRGHYRIDQLLPRHFDETAIRAKVPQPLRDQVFEELAAAGPAAFDQIEADLPPDFPEHIALPILEFGRARLASVIDYATDPALKAGRI